MKALLFLCRGLALGILLLVILTTGGNPVFLISSVNLIIAFFCAAGIICERSGRRGLACISYGLVPVLFFVYAIALMKGAT